MSPSEKTGETPKGFTVTDRRGVDDPGASAPPSAPPPAPAVAAESKPGATKEPPLPPVDFATFVLSLGSSALMHLGEVERPGTGAFEKNLPMAKHSIDILSMLEDKTRGNLTSAEAQLLENLLFDLRLRYVEATKK